MNFGEQIKRIRKEKNLTQQEMADQLNISRQAVSNWENDKNLPDIEMLITMARVFHLTLDELILGGTQMNNMTEKLISDGSKNKRVKMTLIGIIIGGGLLVLGMLTLIIGIFMPPSLENYWSIASSAMTLFGIVAFLTVGGYNAIDLLRDRHGDTVKHKKPIFIGELLILFGIILFGITLLTGAISGLFGITSVFAGIVTVTVAAILSK